MRGLTVTSVLISSLSFAAAQLTFDPNTNSIVCPVPNGSFCAGDSLSTVILVNCQDSQPGLINCIAALTDPGAACYQSSVTAGNAACAANGTAYPSGSPSYKYPTTTTFSSGPQPTPPPAVVAPFNSASGCSCKNGTHPGQPGGHSGYPPLGTGTAVSGAPTTTMISSSIKISVTYKPTQPSQSVQATFLASAAPRIQGSAFALICAGLLSVLLI